MEEKLRALWGKVVQNKELVIRAGCAVVGGLIGAGIATAIANANSVYVLEQFDVTADEAQVARALETMQEELKKTSQQ